ncbi:MAG: hypothetical protein HUU15_09685 [Candidatus Brocadiae bacterium]|nr:hypothetical protein [Candidatus Brocadiia bacterium]
MPSNVSCPGCAAQYDAAGYDPGDQFQCPACSEIVTVGGGTAAPAAPRTAKMPSRGTTRKHASRAPSPPRERTTSKMRVVAGAVGMGALHPSIDPKMIRRAGAPPPPVQEGTDKTLLMVGAGIAALAIIGTVIFIAKQPSAEEKKKAANAKKAAAEAKENEKKATGGGASSTGQPDQPRPPTLTGWDVDPAIDAEVGKILTALRGQPVDENFWKQALPLLRHGREAIPPLVERWAKDHPDMANVSREIVVRATRRGIPEELFSDPMKRHEMAAVFREWWLGDKGQAVQLVPEGEFLGTGGAVAVDPPPGNPGTEKPPPVRPPGGAGEGTIRRDLPQQLANYRTGTFEQREAALQEIRRYGKAVIPHLMQVLNDEDPGVANSAYSVLKEFTKQDFGVMPGDVTDRRKFLNSWTEWWAKNEGSFSM